MKAKVLTSGIIALALVAGVAAPASAVDSTVSPTPKPRAEVRQDKKEALKEKRDEKKEALTVKHQERVQKYWNDMKHRLEILIANQTKLADRIQKNLDERAAKGRDVTEAKAKLDAARVLIAGAETALKDADAKVAGIISSNEPKEALKKIKELNKEVLAKIKEAHKALNEVLKARKAPKPSPSPSASPTVSPTPSA